MPPGKTVLYIDNSNIFRGCKKSGWRPSYRKVREFLEEREGPIWDVHFFASDQEVPREKQARFYHALKDELGFQVHTFHLAHRKVTCKECGRKEWIPTEKGVDVGLVTQLLRDLRNDVFDTALIMSSDRDYFDAVLEVRQAGRKVKIIAWKWNLSPEAMKLFRDKNINLLFLDDWRDKLEKPHGKVL